MREPSFKIDKIVLTTNPDFDPQTLEPNTDTGTDTDTQDGGLPDSDTGTNTDRQDSGTPDAG